MLCAPTVRAQERDAASAVARRVALLVGVDRYLKPGFRDLRFAEADVSAVAQELQHLGFEVTVLLGSAADEQQATLQNIEAAARGLVKTLGKDDLVLVMLSGHGQQLPRTSRVAGDDNDDSYFCPVDAVINDPTTQFSLSHLLDDILTPNVGRNLVLVDACRDAPKQGDRSARNTRGIQGRVISLPEDTAVYFSCRAGQLSFERSEVGHGLFTFCVLEALSDARRRRATLTWSGLVAHVDRRMNEPDLRRLMPESQPQVPIAAGALPYTPLYEGKGPTASLIANPPAGFRDRPPVRLHPQDVERRNSLLAAAAAVDIEPDLTPTQRLTAISGRSLLYALLDEPERAGRELNVATQMVEDQTVEVTRSAFHALLTAMTACRRSEGAQDVIARIIRDRNERIDFQLTIVRTCSVMGRFRDAWRAAAELPDADAQAEALITIADQLSQDCDPANWLLLFRELSRISTATADAAYKEAQWMFRYPALASRQHRDEFLSVGDERVTFSTRVYSTATVRRLDDRSRRDWYRAQLRSIARLPSRDRVVAGQLLAIAANSAGETWLIPDVLATLKSMTTEESTPQHQTVLILLHALAGDRHAAEEQLAGLNPQDQPQVREAIATYLLAGRLGRGELEAAWQATNDATRAEAIRLLIQLGHLVEAERRIDQLPPEQRSLLRSVLLEEWQWHDPDPALAAVIRKLLDDGDADAAHAGFGWLATLAARCYVYDRQDIVADLAALAGRRRPTAVSPDDWARLALLAMLDSSSPVALPDWPEHFTADQRVRCLFHLAREFSEAARLRSRMADSR